MLRRSSDIERLRAALVLPALPDEVSEAETGLRAVAERIAARAAESAKTLAKFRPDLTGAERRPLKAQLDTLNAEVNAARAEQAAANTRLNQLRTRLAGENDQALAGSVADWQRAVERRLAELDELLELGERLDGDYKAARLATNHRTVTGAAGLRRLLAPLARSFTSWRGKEHRHAA